MFGQVGEMKKLYDKYKQLQDKLKNLLIRAKEGSYTADDGSTVEGAVVVDITGEMKVKEVNINDVSLLSLENKKQLEQTLIRAMQKAQTKAQEVVAEKTKEILGFDPSQLGSMMSGGGMPKIPGLS